mmetsp:Transcript_38744/g.60436  ORF Transcript_38744/g.60436 Transcript_38744/m.60436 type:complete len:137 (+) Transcript_38744:543-953(+)
MHALNKVVHLIKNNCFSGDITQPADREQADLRMVRNKPVVAQTGDLVCFGLRTLSCVLSNDCHRFGCNLETSSLYVLAIFSIARSTALREVHLMRGSTSLSVLTSAHLTHSSSGPVIGKEPLAASAHIWTFLRRNR